MKITRIKATNFRQHKAVDLDLSSEQCDFVVIKGRNGAGKTNLLNAVTWAIYGEVDDTNASQQQLLNDSIVSTMAVDSYAEVEVMIEMNLDSSKAFLIRKQTFKKDTSGVKPFGSNELTIQVFKSNSDGYQVQAKPEIWIENNLPKRFRPYFLFDGEKLERFFKDSDAPRIRAAIQEVAQIDLLQRMQEMLGNASTELSQKAAKLSGVNGEDLAQKLGRLGEFIQAKELEILNQEENYQKSSQIESELDKLLSDQENLESNIQRKQEIDSLLKSKELRLLESKNDFGLRLRSIAPSVLLAPTLVSLGVHIEDAKGKGILPPPIDVNYLRELLENGKCICGSSLTLDSDHRKHLEAQIAEYATVSEVGNALNEHSTTYRVLLDRIPGYKDLIDALNQGIKEKEEEQEELLAENALLAQALEGQDNDYVRELASSRAKAREAAMRANHTLQIARSEVIQATSEKDSVEKQIEKAASANAAAKSAGLKAEFGREVAYYSKKLFETMNTQVREAVASSLHDMFQNMMWKKGYFTNIGIDENFRVSVLNNKNIEVLNRLAAGERLCLAFAFSLTLSKEAGLNFPIIVDTPMGRLAPEVQVNLAEVLTEATKSEDKNKNHQIILLMTETEYNEKVAKVFNKRRPKVLEIHFNPETSETSVS